MTVLSRPVRCVTLCNSLPLMFVNLSVQNWLGSPVHPDTWKHAQPHTSTWIQCQQNKAWKQFYSLQWNSNGFTWLWRNSLFGRRALSKQFTNNTPFGNTALPSTSAGYLPMTSTDYFRGPESYTNPRWRGRRKIVKGKNPEKPLCS